MNEGSKCLQHLIFIKAEIYIFVTSRETSLELRIVHTLHKLSFYQRIDKHTMVALHSNKVFII